MTTIADYPYAVLVNRPTEHSWWKKAVNIVAQVAIPFVAPALGSALATSVGFATSALGQTALSAGIGAGLGGGVAAATGQDWRLGAIGGAIGGGIGGYNDIGGYYAANNAAQAPGTIPGYPPADLYGGSGQDALVGSAPAANALVGDTAGLVSSPGMAGTGGGPYTPASSGGGLPPVMASATTGGQTFMPVSGATGAQHAAVAGMHGYKMPVEKSFMDKFTEGIKAGFAPEKLAGHALDAGGRTIAQVGSTLLVPEGSGMTDDQRRLYDLQAAAFQRSNVADQATAGKLNKIADSYIRSTPPAGVYRDRAIKEAQVATARANAERSRGYTPNTRANETRRDALGGVRAVQTAGAAGLKAGEQAYGQRLLTGAQLYQNDPSASYGKNLAGLQTTLSEAERRRPAEQKNAFKTIAGSTIS